MGAATPFNKRWLEFTGSWTAARRCSIREGGNRFQRFAREMNSASSQRLEIEGQLHWALDRGEPQLNYQPQFQLFSRQHQLWRRMGYPPIKVAVTISAT